MNIPMQELPEADRPYEKALLHGVEVLTDTELVAALLRSGTQGESALMLAARLLQASHYEQGLLGLCHLTLPELTAMKGIGQTKAIQILCICELSRRIATAKAEKTICFDSPETIADYYMEQMRHKEQEELRLLMLNSKNKLIRDTILTKGTVNASLVSPREIFLESLKYHAVSVILIHNHPSGDPEPSREDILITKRISYAGTMLGILLIDHIIIGDNRYVSFKERGLLE